MAASEAAVTAVMETLGCQPYNFDGIAFRDGRCRAHRSAFFIDRGCPVAVAAADAAVDADRASIQAETLREAARDLSESTEGPDRRGTAGWVERHRDVYSLAIEESKDALLARAVRIEAV